MQDRSVETVSEDKITFNTLNRINREFEETSPDRILRWGYHTFGSGMVLGTGFGPSGMFLIHRLQKILLDIPVFYLDTHLLFEETYTLRDRLEEQYDIEITRVSTDLSLEEQEQKHGGELWKHEPNRCCYLRKVLPLRNYLSDKKAWITGLRRTHSETRRQTRKVEWDPENEVIKINPLADWTDEQVWDYIYEHELPYNPLHDEGYPSIGCIPCTRPVGVKEHKRDGRWSESEKTECGIHVSSQKYQQTIPG